MNGTPDVTHLQVHPPIDMMIIGSQKCGTSSLQRYLETHPSICSHHTMEFSFFIDDEEWGAGYPKAWVRHFTQEGGVPRVVAKSAGLCAHPRALARLAEHNPKAEVVLMVRDPIGRAYSSYQMDRSQGRPLAAFEEALREAIADPESYERRTFLDYGDYELLYSRAQAHFPASKLHIVHVDDLKAQPAAVCNKLCKVLELDEMPVSTEYRVHNKGKQPRSVWVAGALRRVEKVLQPVRPVLRRVLPRRLATGLSSFVRDVNRTDAQPAAPISSEARALLADYYSERTSRFEKASGVAVFRG